MIRNPATVVALAYVLVIATTTVNSHEADFETAQNWWPPLRNVWTPVGVKNHPFRFTVLYNGTIVADPHPIQDSMGRPIKEYLKPYAGQGVQLTLRPSLDGSLPTSTDQPYQLSSLPDGGVGLQGWNDHHPTPVLWTRWPITHYNGNSGVVVLQEVFAHTPGGQQVVTGKEPLYLWMRLTVEHVDPFDATPNAIMLIHLGNTDMLQRRMWHESNLVVQPDKAIYPRELTRDTYQVGPYSCCRLVEPDGRIRLVGMMTAGSAMLTERTPNSRDYYLKVEMPAVKGTHVDLLLPMIPGAAEAVRAEADLKYDGALVQSDRYWSQRPSTAAVVDTPEPQVNNAVRRLVEMAQVISETNPETGDLSLLTGSWNYDTLWPTPTSMTTHMLLDQLGYHEFVAKNLEIFRKYQGSTKPPGKSYQPHSGYLGAPQHLNYIDWLTDHGAILHAVAENIRLSGDEKMLEHWLKAIIKACDFIVDSRSIKDHDGIPGVLPPAVATDTGVPSQAVWNIAWNYKGLNSAAKLLQRAGHPLADKYCAEASEYKQVFVKAYRERAARMSTWTSDSGVIRKIVPTGLAGPELQSHPFFLDTGPMVLVYAGLLDADDPLMQDALAYYREGPNTKLYDPRGNMHQRAILTHEISTCEPCYSFNILISRGIGDRERFLEGVYGLLSGSLSHQTFSGCEHRHGIWSVPSPGALMFYAMKLAVIDDELDPNSLHLLRLVPQAWIKSDYLTRFENMPTEYGPVDLKFKLADEGQTLDITFVGHWRREPAATVLHVPPLPGLKKIVVNGQSYPPQDKIELPH